ncbi:ADP-ribose glycohydrolase MACROD2 isoform X2 [Kryptolebias marmoratus]|uniref:ADP-ribose glycohydrolase MACROD2 isoform X2 n=1 Tax=Kryptolebias marmoratus TaxID=37003 RepID=UPI0007F93714|nr:ADP-ribose glycohydrolase MACROD2 isoform X2 [Kryptolebias marmoratus]
MSKKKKDWKTEKERLLRLTQEERRKEYRDFKPLEEIPTWREENTPTDKEEEEEQGVPDRGGLSDKVSLYKGDITILEVDAIVNAANTSLLGGGGVDGCIHKAAGSCLYDECHSLNGCETGQAKITCGYDLPAKYVIHTVGPVARGHVGPAVKNDLTSCYQNSLNLVKEHELKSVAFPCISTGIYGYPNEPAADVALNTVKKWIEENPDKITRVIFCVFLETDFAIYKKKMSVIFQDNDMEVTEEQPKGDNTPPSTKSTTKDEREDSKEGEGKTGDEEEGDNDAGQKEDAEMASQNLDENDPNMEQSQEKGNEDQGQGTEEDVSMDNSGDKEDDKDTDINDDPEVEEKQEPVAEPENNDTAAPNVEMKDEPENKADTSINKEVEKAADSNETESIQPKDATENKE